MTRWCCGQWLLACMQKMMFCAKMTIFCQHTSGFVNNWYFLNNNNNITDFTSDFLFSWHTRPNYTTKFLFLKSGCYNLLASIEIVGLLQYISYCRFLPSFYVNLILLLANVTVNYKKQKDNLLKYSVCCFCFLSVNLVEKLSLMLYI